MFRADVFDGLVNHLLDLARGYAGESFAGFADGLMALTADEARGLLDGIAIVRNAARDGRAETDEPALIWLRDRAHTGVMVCTFARISAVLQMKVRDYFVPGRRGWVRLHEKGGKEQ